jgi:thymidylate synthase (FAD)
MRLIDPSIELITKLDGDAILRHLEIPIRNAYKSEDKIGTDSHLNLIKLIMTSKHLSTLEHYQITFKVTCSRACMAQWTRHRIGWAYTIESQRFVNYNKEKFGKQITYIKPINYNDWNTEQQFIFSEHLKISEQAYFKLLEAKLKPEDARNVLNNAVKTDMVVTANLRALLDFLKTRTDRHAQIEIRVLALDLLAKLKAEIPVIFDEL